MTIEFRDLDERDFPLLRRWLAQPYVARWWNHETSSEAVDRDFGPVVRGEEPGDNLLALADGKAFGLVQRSRLADYREYLDQIAALTPVPDGSVTIDYLIGEPNYIGGGFGGRMIRAVVDKTWADDAGATAIVPAVAVGNVGVLAGAREGRSAQDRRGRDGAGQPDRRPGSLRVPNRSALTGTVRTRARHTVPQRRHRKGYSTTQEPGESHVMTQPIERPAGQRETVIGQGVAWLSRWSLRWIIIAVAVVLLWWLVSRAWVIVLPVVIALIVCTVLAPPARLLRERAKFPAALAAGTVIIGAFAVVGGILWALAPSVVDQVGDIAEDASAGLGKVEDWLIDGPFQVSDDQLSTAIGAAQDRLTDSASTIASGVFTGVSAVTSTIIGAALVLVLTFFFLKDGPKFLPWLRRVGGQKAGAHLDVVLLRSWNTLGGFIRTQAVVSFVDAIFIGTGLLIVGVPLAVPLAIMTFFGGFIPIVGAFVFGALAVLVALVSNGLTGALIVLAIVVGVQQLEGNVLSPWLQGRSMKLHAAVILLGVALGSTLFGVVGAFLAVPVIAVAAEMLRYLSETIDAQNPPDDSAVAAGDEDQPDPEQPDAGGDADQAVGAEDAGEAVEATDPSLDRSAP